MTKYLSSVPFSVPVGGKVTELQYDIATGRRIWCERCEGYVKPDHKCPEAARD